MHDAAAVRLTQRRRGLHQDAYGFFRGQNALLVQRRLQRHALDQWHDEVDQPVGLADVVNGDDAGMAHLRHGACFVAEPLAEARRGDQLGAQHLDGDGPGQLEVERGPHFTEAAPAYQPLDVEIGADGILERQLARLHRREIG